MGPAESDAQSRDQGVPNSSAIPTAQDYYATLLQVIEQVSKHPSELRKLIYLLAWHSLRLEHHDSRSTSNETNDIRNIMELDRALKLERAIKHVEAFVALANDESIDVQHPAPSSGQLKLVAMELARAFAATKFNKPQATFAPFASDQSPDNRSQQVGTEQALVTFCEQDRGRPPRTQMITLERIPAWLDPAERLPGSPIEYASIPWRPNVSLWGAPKLVCAAIVGAALCAAGWSYYLGRSSQLNASSSIASRNSPAAAAQPAQSVPAAQPPLPFPLPRSYGVYAVSGSQLIELQQLSLKIPDARISISAEIFKPSQVVVPDGRVSFVVFRRDLMNNAPQTVSVRIVARVARLMKFVEGKATTTPVEGVWRIRSTSFDFKVSPIENQREMIIIQADPDFVLPSGRYALVFNGIGYDFTVPGPVTSPQHCLEQFNAVNGTTLSECPKS
jgi:hypothetical protein